MVVRLIFNKVNGVPRERIATKIREKVRDQTGVRAIVKWFSDQRVYENKSKIKNEKNKNQYIFEVYICRPQESQHFSSF